MTAYVVTGAVDFYRVGDVVELPSDKAPDVSVDRLVGLGVLRPAEGDEGANAVPYGDPAATDDVVLTGLLPQGEPSIHVLAEVVTGEPPVEETQTDSTSKKQDQAAADTGTAAGVAKK